MAIGLALGLAAVSLAQKKVSGVSVAKLPNAVEISVEGKELAKPKLMKLRNGTSYLLEFNGAVLLGKAGRIPVGDHGVSYVNFAQFKRKPAIVRVHFKVTKGSAAPSVLAVDGGWKTTFGGHTITSMPAPTSVAKMPVIEPPFPSTVPPLYPATKPAPVPTVDEAGRLAEQRKVTLDFVNTDIVQILKALAMQAGVNIVTSADVSPSDKPIRVTVALDRVSVAEALDFVTTVGGLRYGKVNNTYIVTSPAKYNEMSNTLSGKKDVITESKVVPIFSGEGNQIKKSVMKMIAAGEGVYNIFLPSESASKQSAGEPAKAEVDKPKEGAPEAKPEAAGGSNPARDNYLLVVGPADRMNEIEAAIRTVDRQIYETSGYKIPSSSSLTRDVYPLRFQNMTAAELAASLRMNGGNLVRNVDLFPSPASNPNQSIVIVGRDTEVNRVKQMLGELDFADFGNDFLMYDVQYSDPRSLREELVSSIKGLRVTIPPASAGNPGLFEEGNARLQGQEVGKAMTNEEVKDQKDGGKEADGVASTSNSQLQEGQLESPFKDGEKTAVPMRLILRGTKKQIEDALAYLRVIDIAPKQIALEMRVMELSKEDAYRAGINWDLFTGGAVKFLRLQNNASNNPGDTSNGFGVNVNGSNIMGDVTGTLDKIAIGNKLLARPNVIAMDGKQTEIFVGDIVRYVISITQSQNGTTVTTGEVPVGVRLSVLPRIGAGGSITLDMRPRISILKGFTDVPGGGKLPQTSSRFAQSTVNIESGETIAIGGLIQDNDRKDMSGVPILMDLPVLGQFFRRTNNSRLRTEVVIFLTAKKIEGPMRTGDKNLPIEKDSAMNKTKGGK